MKSPNVYSWTNTYYATAPVFCHINNYRTPTTVMCSTGKHYEKLGTFNDLPPGRVGDGVRGASGAPFNPFSKVDGADALDTATFRIPFP